MERRAQLGGGPLEVRGRAWAALGSAGKELAECEEELAKWLSVLAEEEF